MGIDRVYPSPPCATLGPGLIDGVTDAMVQEPASTALVEAQSPGSVELSSGGQRGVVLLAVGQGLVIGKTITRPCMEHLACREAGGRERMVRKVGRIARKG